jgi:hypothetical protein
MSRANLIQIEQIYKPEISGFILDVINPYTGFRQTPASGTNQQIQFNKSGYLAGSELYYDFVNGRVGFGTSAPIFDFHLSGKNFKIDAGTGYFSQAFVGSERVIGFYELSMSGVALSGSLILTGSNLDSGINSIKSWTGTTTGLFYPREQNPNGYVTSDLTGILYEKSNPSGFITGTKIRESTITGSYSSGIKGDAAFDSNYLYLCTSGNFWKRIALNTGMF